MSTHRAENLTAAGPSGTGKSHFVEALAHEAIEEGMQVAWFTLESLTAHLGRATVDNSVSKAAAKITRCHFIVIDDTGMLPWGQAAAEAFYRVIDAAYERRSVIVTSNLHPSKAHMFRRTRARYCQHVTGSMVPRRLPSHPGVRAKRL
ncbi:ATP-binding protein [Streptomyces sviceus]|uniref:ATP-binding protein n=1 Tax=Streptomyces sviceus TaxID=285530 RepID=UPI003698AD3C